MKTSLKWFSSKVWHVKTYNTFRQLLKRKKCSGDILRAEIETLTISAPTKTAMLEILTVSEAGARTRATAENGKCSIQTLYIPIGAGASHMKAEVFDETPLADSYL